MSALAGGAENPFWRFSLAFYARDGVAPACLRLQDRDGLDVNIVLYCCWAAAQGAALDEVAMAATIAATTAWRLEVVQPLRSVRRALRGGIPPVPVPAAAALRDEVKRLELEAERLLQDALWRGFPLPRPSQDQVAGDLALANLECYGRAAGVKVNGADLQTVAGALNGASPS